MIPLISYTSLELIPHLFQKYLREMIISLYVNITFQIIFLYTPNV